MDHNLPVILMNKITNGPEKLQVMVRTHELLYFGNIVHTMPWTRKSRKPGLLEQKNWYRFSIDIPDFFSMFSVSVD